MVAAKRVVYKACKACMFISESDTCPRCGAATTKDWQGMVAISDATRSDIAKQMGITANGTYALRVR